MKNLKYSADSKFHFNEIFKNETNRTYKTLPINEK